MFENDQRERAGRLAPLRAETGAGRSDAIADVVTRLMNERGLKLDKGSAEYRKLAQGVARAELEALARSQERDTGDFGGKPTDPIVRPPTIVAHTPGETILELFDRYRKERRRGISDDTWNQNRKFVALFDDFVGGKQHASQLNRKNVRDWKTKLFEWPTKAAELSVFKGMSFLKVIEHNEVLKKRTISEKTINKYLAALGSFTRWLLANDYVSENVTDGLYLEVDKSQKTVLPYSADKLKALFASPLFARCAGEEANDEEDDLDEEIAKKFRKGYSAATASGRCDSAKRAASC
jgi:hypothetical protein